MKHLSPPEAIDVQNALADLVNFGGTTDWVYILEQAKSLTFDPQKAVSILRVDAA